MPTTILCLLQIIFITEKQTDALKSFSIPFTCMREVGLEQPVFGANHIKGGVVAEIGGNWVGQAKFKLWFYSGGAIEFGQAMMHAGQLGELSQMVEQYAAGLWYYLLKEIDCKSKFIHHYCQI